ncbi:6,7-dimethyl-8-ribityllumazine synthase [Candidatus Peregrinibacteria bacterium CG10_big_fil_rev_8_21_14_0_10_36_19]|nr:MAG: 6,7-dimethyl-8-ribityllumazine synthase [Candidatus Peregrinibacteria bacterium CG10_big_fil_rev_8_21_14_0_10_36_19]
MEINLPTNLELSGEGKKITIILPYFNDELGTELLKNTEKELKSLKTTEIQIVRVFGTMELPFACQKIIEKEKPDAIIALGIVIRGETKHFDLVNEITHQGLMNVQLELKTPIIFGILACENKQQAIDRLNKGKHFAQTALLQISL